MYNNDSKAKNNLTTEDVSKKTKTIDTTSKNGHENVHPTLTVPPWKFVLDQRKDHSCDDSTKFSQLVPIEITACTHPLPSDGYGYNDYMRSEPFIPIEYFPTVGLSFQDAQQLNLKMMQAAIDLQVLHAANQEDFSYMLAKDEYQRQQMSYTGTIRSADGQLIPIPNRTRPNFCEFEQSFIQKFALVKVRSKYSGKWSFMIRSQDYNRHVPINEMALKQEYIFFLDEHLPEGDNSSQAVMENSFQHMKRRIQKLQDSHLNILTETEIMFSDGVYNVEKHVFTFVPFEERNKYFNIFSIEIPFGSGESASTAVFDAYLNLILDNNPESVKLVYQMIGAILTPTSTFKKCFLLQGVHDSGKTTLVNYIKELMTFEDTIELPNISGLTDNSLTNCTTPIRLIHISELGTNKLTSKQIVNMKAFADGSRDTPGSSSFKLIMTTNHKITTGDGDVVEPAIKNRLLVIPFPVSIDFSKADPKVQALNEIYFQKEMRGIILKALIAYSEVLNNNNQFCINYDVNAVVDTPTDNNAYLDNNEREALYAGIGQPTLPLNALEEILRTGFVLTTEVNPSMTTKLVMNAVNLVRDGLLQNEASTGRKLQEYFGDNLKSARLNGSTCYNLEFAVPSDAPEDSPQKK